MRISYGSSDVYSSDLYRRLLMGGFMPKKVRQYSEVARETAQALVAALKPRGECEFIDEFAKVLPINVFLTMMGLPLDDRAFLLPRAELAVRSNDVELTTKPQMALARYLMGPIEDRQTHQTPATQGTELNGARE